MVLYNIPDCNRLASKEQQQQEEEEEALIVSQDCLYVHPACFILLAALSIWLGQGSLL